MNPSVAVIIPCFNASITIERAVLSVLDQTQSVSQIIIIDDNSNDDTVSVINNILSKYQNRGKFLFYPSTVNVGPGYARNIGINLADAAYISFLDADDAWHPRKIELQMNLFKCNPNIDILAHKSNMWSGDYGCVENFSSIQQIRLLRLLIGNKIGTRTVIMKSCINLRFMDRRFSEDYLYWLTCLKQGYRIGYTSDILAYTFRPEFSDGGYSGQLFNQWIREIRTYCEFSKGSLFFRLILPILLLYSGAKYCRRQVINNFIR